VFAAFADVSLLQLALIAGVALIASIIGGVAGYGTGALMPLVLVPIVGPEPVVPILAISALLTNTARATAFFGLVSWRRVGLVLAGAIVPCLASAYGYTLLTGRGVQFMIGGMLVLTVPLRYLLRKRAVALGDRGLLLSSAGFGAAVGGTVGAGVIMLSLLMATGLQGAAVIATDAVLSIAIGISRLMVFGMAGAIDGRVLAYALLIGLIAFPSAFLARAFVTRLPVHVHTAILDAVVLIGGMLMVMGALTR
jgi:uncharacterized membrane protein YfcA